MDLEIPQSPCSRKRLPSDAGSSTVAGSKHREQTSGSPLAPDYPTANSGDRGVGDTGGGEDVADTDEVDVVTDADDFDVVADSSNGIVGDTGGGDDVVVDADSDGAASNSYLPVPQATKRRGKLLESHPLAKAIFTVGSLTLKADAVVFEEVTSPEPRPALD
eukprot:gene18656-25173_t